MKRSILACCVVICSYLSVAQTVFTSTAVGGNWNRGTTWDQTTCTSSCVAGVDYPGAGDIAIIAVSGGGYVAFPKASGGASYFCKDLFVVQDAVAGVRTTGLSGSATLTVSGQISGALNDLSGFSETTVDVFHSTASTLTITFTGTQLEDPISGAVITAWGHSSPFYRITFNPGTGNTIRTDAHSVRSSSTVQSGSVQINSGQVVQGAGQLIVDPSASLLVVGEINGDGTTSSRFGTVTVNGTLTTDASGYVNATTFSLGSSSALNVGFNGINQTQGWWHQSAIPTTMTIANTSTVTYTASTAQNIYSTAYGNLSLSSLSPVTKMLNGTGLTVQGNLTIGANVTFSPATQVGFTGTASQNISGSGTLTFDGGMEVNKSSGTLTLSKDVSANGITVASGSLDLGNVSTTLSGGSFLNSGTVTSGASGTLAVTGTSTFSGSGSLTLNNLSITGEASINNDALSVTGNITNNGILAMSSTSTLTFSGGLSQTISGNAFTVGNMVVNKPSSTLFNNGNVELLRVLTLTTGTFDADGSGSGVFTLNSDTNGDASIGQMSGGSISGEVTFERYFNNTNNRWRNIGFPVTSVTFAELGSSITLTNGSLATYTESTLGNADQGWNIVTSGSTLNSRKGHSAYMYNVAPITISVRGPLLQNVPSTSESPYDYQVTYTDDPAQPSTQDGWNFVPNPYASPINWKASSGWTLSGVNTAAAVWDAQGGVYQYSNVAWDGVVAQGQSFWVQTNATQPSLTSTESVKVTNFDPSFFRINANETRENRLLITLGDGKNTDKAVVQFKRNAKEEFDPLLDATKLANLIFNLSSLSTGGLNLAANVLPTPSCTKSVKLNLTNITPGKYFLQFDGLETFSNVEVITLFDHYTKSSRILKQGENFSFSIDENTGSFGSERLELRFSFLDNAITSPEITVKNRKLMSNYLEGNQWYHNGMAIPGATGASITASRIGTYQLEVSTNGCTIFSPSIDIMNGAARVFPNPADEYVVVDLAGLSDAEGRINLIDLSGDRVLKESFRIGEKSKQLQVNGIKAGVYVLKIISEQGEVLMEERIVIKK